MTSRLGTGKRLTLFYSAWLFPASITSQISLQFHPRAGQKVRGSISLFFTVSLVETDARGLGGGGPFNNSRDTVIAGRYINYKQVWEEVGAAFMEKGQYIFQRRELWCQKEKIHCFKMVL